MSFRVSEATRNLINTKLEFCHSEHRRCEESLLLYKHKLFFTLRWRYFWRKSNQNVGDGVDRRQWRMKGDGGRENNEQTRGASARRSMRRLFFRAIYGCDSPTPQRCTSVECSVCYKSGKITNLIHFVPSHCNFPSIYTSISLPVSYAVLCLPWLSACSPQTSPLLFGESISPNPFLLAKSQFVEL